VRNPSALAAGRPPLALGLAGTIAVHALLVLTITLGQRGADRRPMPIAYRVNLVAAPAAAPAASEPPAAAAPQSIALPRRTSIFSFSFSVRTIHKHGR